MPKKPFRFGFVIDPLENFNPEAETTLFLMAEAQARGHRIFAVTLSGLFSQSGSVYGRGMEIKILGVNRSPFYRPIKPMTLDLAGLEALFLRKDPPFDLPYLHHLYLLQQIRGKVFMLNDPTGILRHSEKIFSLGFPLFTPESLITRDFGEVERFARARRRGIVLKPLNGAGGWGIFYLRSGDSNLKVAFETLSKEGREYVIVQEYLPEVQRQGDKRIMLLNGEILGRFTRLPRAGEHRANLHRGGLLKPCALSSREQKIAREVGDVLRKEGLYFVGLDLIGEKLTEVNVTSPMGINEMNRMMRIRSEKKVIDFVEGKIRS
jgi:glutathione synthase